MENSCQGDTPAALPLDRILNVGLQKRSPVVGVQGHRGALAEAAQILRLGAEYTLTIPPFDPRRH
jgi:hypothetical protein